MTVVKKRKKNFINLIIRSMVYVYKGYIIRYLGELGNNPKKIEQGF